MAFIGMRHVVVAPLSAHTDGSEPTYGTGKDAGKAILGNLTITRNNNPLYADDSVAEDDNGTTAMDLELGLDDIAEDVQETMGLIKKVETGTGTTVVTYYDTDESAVPVGIGYIRVRRKNGITSYQAVWMYKVVFGMTAESSATKGESIEWQTPTITGRGAGIAITGNGERTFRQKRLFSTEAAAAAWLDGLANITR